MEKGVEESRHDFATQEGLIMTKTIHDHEGKKYLRTIRSCIDGTTIQVDVYSVLRAFNITCPIVSHMVKKLLCAGERGKGDRLADLIGVEAAVSRAIEEEKRDREEMERDRVNSPSSPILKIEGGRVVRDNHGFAHEDPQEYT